MRQILLGLVFVCGGATAAAAQTMTPPPFARAVELAGPRFGFTMLTQGVVNKLADERDIHVKPVISQFGWQFEKEFYSKGSSVTALHEWIPMLGGLDQGVVIPSFNWLVGLRTKEGAEFGIGPNVTPVGVGLVIAAGVTFRAGALNVPMNFAVVPSQSGVRVSVLTGFTLRR